MDSSQFEDIQGGLRAILIRVADQLPVDTFGFVDEFIDHGEFGVAVETMSAVLVESGGCIDSDTLAIVRSLVSTMGLSQEVYERLEPLLDDRDCAGSSE